jgi:hypothetical protein
VPAERCISGLLKCPQTYALAVRYTQAKAAQIYERNPPRVGRSKERRGEMLFEIINPSDKAFIEASIFEVACVAVSILGEGQYGLKEVDGDNKMPVFLFGNPDYFFKNKFGKTFEEVLVSTDRDEIVKALESVRLEGERTSLNDIVGAARVWACNLKR